MRCSATEGSEIRSKSAIRRRQIGEFAACREHHAEIDRFASRAQLEGESVDANRDADDAATDCACRPGPNSHATSSQPEALDPTPLAQTKRRYARRANLRIVPRSWPTSVQAAKTASAGDAANVERTLLRRPLRLFGVDASAVGLES